MGNDDLALVQTRWAFVNKDENLLTRLQNINLSFHFVVEQVNGLFINFFGFNGTAGVWRAKALEDCGGWLDRTTVEGMDVAVRAHLCEWRFIYLTDVKVSLAKKANMIFLFFLLRELILSFYSFTLFCIILPLSMFLPEAQLPAWVVCYVPGIMPMLNILPAPRSFPFIVPYRLFENTMSVTKFNATVSGLFRFRNSYEWMVIKKRGRSSEADLIAMMETESEPLVESTSLRMSSSESCLAELNKLQVTKKSGKTKAQPSVQDGTCSSIYIVKCLSEKLAVCPRHSFLLPTVSRDHISGCWSGSDWIADRLNSPLNLALLRSLLRGLSWGEKPAKPSLK